MILLSALLAIVFGALALFGVVPGIGLPLVGAIFGANALIRLRRPGAKPSRQASYAAWFGIALCGIAIVVLVTGVSRGAL
jgi:hypothetical protein